MRQKISSLSSKFWAWPGARRSLWDLSTREVFVSERLGCQTVTEEDKNAASSLKPVGKPTGPSEHLPGVPNPTAR